MYRVFYRDINGVAIETGTTKREELGAFLNRLHKEGYALHSLTKEEVVLVKI